MQYTAMEAQSTNTKIFHKWTIENYNFFYIEDHASPTFIQSAPFSASNNKRNCSKFFLRLHPNGVESNGNGHISLFLHLLEGPDVKVDCKFSVMKLKGIKTDTKGTSGILTKYNELGSVQFMTNDLTFLVKNGYLVKCCNLTIICDIEILDQPNLKESSETIENESKSDASIPVLTHEYKWNIEKFPSLHKKNRNVLSDDFPLANMETLKLSLRLWPNGRSSEKESKNHVALFLYRGDCDDQRHLTAQSKVSIVDAQEQFKNQKWIHGKLVGSKGFGCDRFIDCANLFAHAHELLPENYLKINCEIEVFHKDFSIAQEETPHSPTKMFLEQIFENLSNNLDSDNKIVNLNFTISNSMVSLASSTQVGGNVHLLSS